MLTADVLVGLLAEPIRRRVIATLVLGSGTLDEVAARSATTKRETVEALARIEQAGLAICGNDGTWVVLDEAFSIAARMRPAAPVSDEHADEPAEHQHVLKQCLVDNRIVHWPTKRAKRRIVLERLAQEFEPGLRYSEREVNAMLRSFHDDVAMLRRWLFDESFLDRADGEYWRTGGRVDAT